ncbi:MAG: 16S rRNA (guanine(966)-N(2))-methyltransferase RsmD [bacterium]
MKILNGQNKGGKLSSFKDKNIRPIKNIVKQALFNILQEKIFQSKILDLFSGTGGIGIEALSRNANFVTFVDKSLLSIKMIEENLKKFNLNSKANVLKKDVLKAINFLIAKNEKFNIIFITPPYYKDLEIKCLEIIDPLLLNNGIIIIQHYKKTILPSNTEKLVKTKEKKYGETILSFFENKY